MTSNLQETKAGWGVIAMLAAAQRVRAITQNPPSISGAAGLALKIRDEKQRKRCKYNDYFISWTKVCVSSNNVQHTW